MLLPGIMAVFLLGTVTYYLFLNHQNRTLLKEIRALEADLDRARGSLLALEEWERVQGSSLFRNMAQWVPLFADTLEARLRLEGRLLDVFREVKATEMSVEWKNPVEEKGIAQARLTTRGLFPSFEALLKWLRELEEGAPPMLPTSFEIHKEGTRLRVSASLLTYFRVNRGTL